MRVIIILLTLLPLYLSSQINILLEETFGDSLLNESGNLIEKTKQNYFLAGNFEREPGFDNLDLDVWVRMLDSSGNIISSDTIGSEFSENVKAISKLSNGDIILGLDYAVGAIPNNFRHVMLIRYDTLGQKVWEKEILSFGNSPAILNDMDIDSDDNIYLLAPRPGFPWPKIIKLNSDGNIIWEKSYPESSNEMYFNKIAVSGSDFLYVMGGANNNNHDDFHLFKLDNSGEILKSDTISLNPNSSLKIIQDLIIGKDNSIYFTVGNKSINKIDPLGRIIYQKEFERPQFNAPTILGINLLPNNNLIVNGNLSDINSEFYCGGENRAQGWIFELDQSANILWSHTIGGIYDERINSVKVIDSTNLAFIGIYVNENHQTGDAWFSKINLDSIRLTPFIFEGPNKACIGEQTLVEEPNLNYDFQWHWDNPNLISHIDTTLNNDILITWKDMGTINICASSDEINCIINESCLQIEIGGTTSSVIDTSICEGTFIEVGDTIINSEGYHEVVIQNSFGCDSINEVFITFIPNEILLTSTEQICFGDSLIWQGYFLTQEGYYSDTLTSLNGCDSVLSLSLSFYNTPNLIDTLIINDDGTNSGSITLNFSDTTAYHFLWNTGDTTSSIRNLGTGLYTLLLTYEDNCQQTFIFQVNGVSNTEENYYSGFHTYPNPVTDQLTIELNEIQLEWLRIVDITGREILRELKLTGDTKIDIDHFKSGIYFIEGKGYHGEKYSDKLLKL